MKEYLHILYKKAILSVLVNVHFNSFQTNERTNIKLGTIHNHLEVSALCHDVIIKDNLF